MYVKREVYVWKEICENGKRPNPQEASVLRQAKWSFVGLFGYILACFPDLRHAKWVKVRRMSKLVVSFWIIQVSLVDLF